MPLEKDILIYCSKMEFPILKLFIWLKKRKKCLLFAVFHWSTFIPIHKTWLLLIEFIRCIQWTLWPPCRLKQLDHLHCSHPSQWVSDGRFVIQIDVPFRKFFLSLKSYFILPHDCIDLYNKIKNNLDSQEILTWAILPQQRIQLMPKLAVIGLKKITLCNTTKSLKHFYNIALYRFFLIVLPMN